MDNNHRLSCAVCAARHNYSPVRHRSSSSPSTGPRYPSSSSSSRPRSPSPPPVSSSTTTGNLLTVPGPSSTATDEHIRNLEYHVQFLTNENNQRKSEIQNFLSLIQELLQQQQKIKEENVRLHHHLENIFREIERNAKDPVVISSSSSVPVILSPPPSSLPSGNTNNYPPPPPYYPHPPSVSFSSLSVVDHPPRTNDVLPASPYAMKALAQETARLRSLAVLNGSIASPILPYSNQ